MRIATRSSFTSSKFAVRTASTSKAASLRAVSATKATSHRTAPSAHTVTGKPAFTLTPARTPASSSTSHSAPNRETKMTSRTTTAHYIPRRTARHPAVPHNNHLYTTRSTLHRGEALSKEWNSPGEFQVEYHGLLAQYRDSSEKMEG